MKLTKLSGHWTCHWRVCGRNHWMAMDFLDTGHRCENVPNIWTTSASLTSQQSGILAIISFFILHETYEPILLKRKARGLKRLTKHSTYICSTADTQPTHVLFARAVTRPTKMLLFSPIVLLLAVSTI